MPLATPAGAPLTQAQQVARIIWGYEPAARGRRFIAEPYLPPHATYIPREMRFAVVNRHGRLLRAWRVTSKTSIDEDIFAGPQLRNGRVVADFLTANGPGTLEHLFVRLDAKGLDAKASIPYRLWGNEETPDVRIGPNGRIYQLSTSPDTGIVIRRYGLGR
jgi:hypothetical protein